MRQSRDAVALEHMRSPLSNVVVDKIKVRFLRIISMELSSDMPNVYRPAWPKCSIVWCCLGVAVQSACMTMQATFNVQKSPESGSLFFFDSLGRSNFLPSTWALPVHVSGTHTSTGSTCRRIANLTANKPKVQVRYS